MPKNTPQIVPLAENPAINKEIPVQSSAIGPGFPTGNEAQPVRRFMPIEEAAEYLGFSTSYLYKQVSNRAIPFVKIGYAVRFDRQDLDNWVDQHRIAPVSEKAGA